MTDKTNITIAGDWAKPANTLLEKISDAIGGTLQPWHIKKVAKAEGEAKVIDAVATAASNEILVRAGLEQFDVAHRAIHRMVSSEINKQLNIENITRLALEKLNADAKPENVERDFISNLFEKASGTSNEEMQGLWSSILAGEANKPGTFSKRTVSLVASMDRADAELFTRFCSCCWMSGDEVTALLDVKSPEQTTKLGVKFIDFVHLESLGLLKFDPTAGFKRILTAESFPIHFVMHYFGAKVIFIVTEGPTDLRTGSVLLTDSGKQLAVISGAVPSTEMRDGALSFMLAANREIFSEWPKSVS